MQRHMTVMWKSHRLRMTMMHGSTLAIERNLDIEWTSTLQHNHLQAVVPRPPARLEGNRQASIYSARNSSPNTAVRGVAALRCRSPPDPAVALDSPLVIDF